MTIAETPPKPRHSVPENCGRESHETRERHHREDGYRHRRKKTHLRSGEHPRESGAEPALEDEQEGRRDEHRNPEVVEEDQEVGKLRERGTEGSRERGEFEDRRDGFAGHPLLAAQLEDTVDGVDDGDLRQETRRRNARHPVAPLLDAAAGVGVGVGFFGGGGRGRGHAYR